MLFDLSNYDYFLYQTVYDGSENAYKSDTILHKINIYFIQYFYSYTNFSISFIWILLQFLTLNFLTFYFNSFFLFSFNQCSSLFWSFFSFNSFKSFLVFTSVTFSKFFTTNIYIILSYISDRCFYLLLSKLFKNILNIIESLQKIMNLALKSFKALTIYFI